MTKKILPILILIFLVAVLPLALILTKQRQEIRKKAATNDINVYLNTSTLSPNGTTSGGVIVQVGTPVVDTATAHINYDSAKITLPNLHCGSGLTQQFIQTTPGDLVIRCFKQGGFPAGAVAFALFDVAAGSTVGDYTISLGQNTQLVSNSTVVTGNKVPSTLHITTTAVPVFFSFASSAVSPGGSNSGTVKLTAGSVPITTAKLVFTYDTNKVTVSGLDCDGNFSKTIDPIISSGKAEIVCSYQAGVSGNTFNVAKFNIAILSAATVGNVEFNFVTTTGNSRLTKADSTGVPATFTSGSFQISGGTPPPGGITVSPACQAPGGNVTISGSGFGTTQGRVIFSTIDLGYCLSSNNWAGCGADAQITSWSDTNIAVKVPANITNANGVKIVIIKPGATSYITPVPTVNVNSNCPVVTPTPTATPIVTPTATPSPTATLDPNRPASFTLIPASSTVGSNPVLVEIKLNSATKKVNSAQVVINIDSKLSVVNSNGNAVTQIIPGNTALTLVQTNSYASHVITFGAGKASGTTAATTINGTFAKFYVKTTQTSGTATMSFVTDVVMYNGSYVTDENSVNILGSAPSVTVNLGSGGGPTTPPGAPSNSISAGAVTVDGQGRYHVTLTLSASPAPQLTIGGETAQNVVKIIGAGVDRATPDATIAQIFATYDCTNTFPTGGKAYCLSSMPTGNTIDVIFNPGITGARYLWATFHNDANHTAASYWSSYVANSSWSLPVRTEAVNIPLPGGNTITSDRSVATLGSDGYYFVNVTTSADPAPSGDASGKRVKIIGAPASTTVTKEHFSGACADDFPATTPVCLAATGTRVVKFNLASYGQRKVCAIFHNDTSASDGWSQPVCTGAITVPEPGTSFTFKLKFYGIDAKPTTPDVDGLDYDHEKTKVIIKSGTTDILTKTDVVLTAGAEGVYTSEAIDVSSIPAGTYWLFVKPVGYYQKRFTGIVIPSSGVIDLTSSNYRFEPGDLNNDGVINLVDLTDLVNRIEMNKDKYNNPDLTAAEWKKYDYDRDGHLMGGDTAGVIETMNHRYDDE